MSQGWPALYSNSIEVFDLNSPPKKCRTLPNFPTIDATVPIGGLGFQNKPIICGGSNGNPDSSCTNKCYTFQSEVWTPSPNMNKPRCGAGFAPFPSQNQSRRLIVTGGYLDPNTAEVLTEKGWEMFPLAAPTKLESGYCTLTINSTTLMIIGGGQKTYYLNTERNVWTEGPVLNVDRYYFFFLFHVGSSVTCS
jgi:hypothetical protein